MGTGHAGRQDSGATAPSDPAQREQAGCQQYPGSRLRNESEAGLGSYEVGGRRTGSRKARALEGIEVRAEVIGSQNIPERRHQVRIRHASVAARKLLQHVDKGAST